MLNRLLGMIYILMNRQNVTAAELAERFEVSVRTVYRDVETLSMAGIPVYTRKGKNKNGELSQKEWMKFFMIPLFTIGAMLLMFFCSSMEAKVQTAYLFLSAGLIFIKIPVIELMQGIL